jgi:hypothetical protein
MSYRLAPEVNAAFRLGFCQPPTPHFVEALARADNPGGLIHFAKIVV